MFTFSTILFVLLIHFLADFGLQTNEQATNKSSSIKYLAYHVGVYSLIWLIAAWFYFDYFILALAFSAITFIFHFATDYVTSRVGKPYWAKQDLHNGFVIVGFDQVLHYIQLFLTIEFISYSKTILGL